MSVAELLRKLMEPGERWNQIAGTQQCIPAASSLPILCLERLQLPPEPAPAPREITGATCKVQLYSGDILSSDKWSSEVTWCCSFITLGFVNHQCKSNNLFFMKIKGTMTTGLHLCQNIRGIGITLQLRALWSSRSPSCPSFLYLITVVCSLSETFLEWKPLGFSQLERHTKMLPIQTDFNPSHTCSKLIHLPTASSDFKGTILCKSNSWAYNT